MTSRGSAICTSGESWWGKEIWESASTGLTTEVPRTRVAEVVEEQAGAEEGQARDVEVGAGGEEVVSVRMWKSGSLSGTVVVEDVE